MKRNYKYNGMIYSNCDIKYLRVIGSDAFWHHNTGVINKSTHSSDFLLKDKNWIPIRTFKDYLKLI